jgi:hypothetical protein
MIIGSNSGADTRPSSRESLPEEPGVLSSYGMGTYEVLEVSGSECRMKAISSGEATGFERQAAKWLTALALPHRHADALPQNSIPSKAAPCPIALLRIVADDLATT